MISYGSIEMEDYEHNIMDVWKSISSSAIERSIIEIKKETLLDLIEEEVLRIS